MVDGDGPLTLPEGCATTPPPATAANPPLPSGACGLRVTIVVDASASIDTGAVRSTLSAIVDALVDTGSTLAVVEFSSAADVRIGATPLDASSRDGFDGYIAGFSAGGSSNLGAGLAAAAVGSPDVTVVVTDGVVNAGGANPGAGVGLRRRAGQPVEGGRQPHRRHRRRQHRLGDAGSDQRTGCRQRLQRRRRRRHRRQPGRRRQRRLRAARIGGGGHRHPRRPFGLSQHWRDHDPRHRVSEPDGPGKPHTRRRSRCPA